MTPCTLTIRHRLTAARLALVAAAVFMSGCATRVPTMVSPAVDHKTLGRIAVVTAADVPTVELDGFPPDTITDPSLAAAGGAAGGAIGCVLGGAMGGSFGGPPGAALGAAIGVALMPVCAVAGAIKAGTEAATDAAHAPDSANAHRQANALFVQEALRRSVEAAMRAASLDVAEFAEDELAAARNPAQLVARGVDTVLEVRVDEFGTSPANRLLLTRDDQPMTKINAAVRVLRTRDAAEVYSADVKYFGRWRNVDDWLADQGRPLIDDLRHGIDELGRTIYENLFSTYHLPGLAPIEPPVDGTLDERAIAGDDGPFAALADLLLEAMDVFDWATVANHQPRLVWEAFPRQSDRTSAVEDMARVTDVRYELVIAREEGLGASQIVYRRDRIATPEHVVEQALPPNGRFFWSVRARFTLDGREYNNEWGSRYQLTTTPSAFSYRFKTGP